MSVRVVVSFEVKKSGAAGREDVDAKFDMAGTWRATIEWHAPPPGSATVVAGVQ